MTPQLQSTSHWMHSLPKRFDAFWKEGAIPVGIQVDMACSLPEFLKELFFEMIEFPPNFLQLQTVKSEWPYHPAIAKYCKSLMFKVKLFLFSAIS